MKKYGKNVLAEHSTYYNNRTVDVLVLEDKDYYNIHVIDDKFQDDELNTLKLQEPKNNDVLEKIKTPMYMECMALEHLLWDKFYGYNKQIHDFTVYLQDSVNL